MNREDYFAELEMRERAVAKRRLGYADTPFAPKRYVGLKEHSEHTHGDALIVAQHAFFENSSVELRQSRVAPTTACSAVQNAKNREIVAKLQLRTTLAQRIGVSVDQVTAVTTSGRDVETAISAYNAAGFNDTYYVCTPSGQEVVDAYNAETNVLNALYPRAIRASNQLFSNANAELVKLREDASLVARTRLEFEVTTLGGSGIQEIVDAHIAFDIQERLVNAFYFGSWWDQHNQKASLFYRAVVDAHNAEAKDSVIDELDRLRDEYVTSADRPVPPRSAFTTSASSAHFSFSELNHGDYRWALVSDRLLAGLEAVRSSVGDKPLTLASAYRNPRRNDSLPDGVYNSRHQYGDAADVCPSDFNEDGTIDALDRDLLHAAAEEAGFNEIIDKTICVHMANE